MGGTINTSMMRSSSGSTLVIAASNLQNKSNTNIKYNNINNTNTIQLNYKNQIIQKERATDPAEVAEGFCQKWLTNGVESGDAGDYMIETNPAGTAQADTINDFA